MRGISFSILPFYHQTLRMMEVKDLSSTKASLGRCTDHPRNTYVCRDLVDPTHRAILVNMNPSDSLDLANLRRTDITSFSSVGSS